MIKLSEDEQSGYDILSPHMPADLAIDIVRKRMAKDTVKPFCAYRAKLTLSVLLKSPDVALAAWEYVNRDRNRDNLTVEYVKACLHYDAETGIFTRRIYRGRNSQAGSSEFCVGSHGYKEVFLVGKLYLLHRLAWFYTYGVWPDFLDHIDRDKLNNRLANLRPCTAQENNWNLPKLSSNKSGVTGVTWDKRKSKWYASIQVNGRTKSLGYYEGIQDAETAYLNAVSLYRGHFLEAAQ